MPSASVPVTAVGPVAAATMAYRDNGVVNLVVIVKTTFAFALDGPMQIAQAEPIFVKEAHRMNNPTRSIVATSDLLPRLPGADVLVLGHAYAPGGSATHGEVRLGVGRGDTVLLDKTIHVVGDRKGGDVKPFQAIPIVYEKAFGGPGCRDNPLGMGALSGDASPNLVDPAAPERPIAFGPISRTWPARSSLVSAEIRAGFERPIAEIPPGFDYRYFHAAPPDQRLPHLLGDEWIVLQGMHPDVPHMELQLPGAQARVRVSGLEPEARVFTLRADTLRIDVDAERCTIVWRNSFPVREADLASMRLQAGVALPDAPIVWPPLGPPERAPAPGANATADATNVAARAAHAAGGTMIIDDAPPAAASLSGTMEVSDEDIESVHLHSPAGDFSRTTVLGSTRVPPTTPLPPKEGTADLTDHFAAAARAVTPFGGGRERSAVEARSEGPIPGSPWDPERDAVPMLEEASTYDVQGTDLTGTLASPTGPTPQEPKPRVQVSPGASAPAEPPAPESPASAEQASGQSSLRGSLYKRFKK